MAGGGGGSGNSVLMCGCGEVSFFHDICVYNTTYTYWTIYKK